MPEKAYYCIESRSTGRISVLELHPQGEILPFCSSTKIEALQRCIQELLTCLHNAQEQLDHEIFIQEMSPKDTTIPEGWGDCSAIKAPNCPNNVCTNH